MKENVRSVIEKQENMRLDSANSIKITSLRIMSYVVGSTFLTIHFKPFDFIEWFDLSSNPKSFFERSSVTNFLVDYIMCIHI